MNLCNLTPAMKGQRSKLLICDLVIPDRQPEPRKVLLDMNMLFITGKERSVKQWRELLGGEGFLIEKIHGLHNPGNSVIEAVLRD